MRAERTPSLVQGALGVEIKVCIGKLRAVTVGIVDFHFLAVPEFRPNVITSWLARQHSAKKALRMAFLHGRALASGHDGRRFRLGQKGPHFPAGLTTLLADAVRPKDPERIAVVSANNRFYFFNGHGV